MSDHSMEASESKEVPNDIAIAEYTQMSEMAKQHASYRFTMFGFFVTLSTAIIGASGWLLLSQGKLIASGVIAFFGLCTSIAAIIIDVRTMQLYDQCEQHAKQVEEKWRKKWRLPTSCGIYTALATGKRRKIYNHTFGIRLLYLLSGFLCVMIIIYGIAT